MFSINGPPKGQNSTSDQSSYDLVYKDIIVNYPPQVSNVAGNLDKYSVSLNFEFDQLYKAELIVGAVHFVTIAEAPNNPDKSIAIPDTVRNSTIIVNIPQLKNNTLSISSQQSTNINSTSIPPIPGNNNSVYISNIFCQIPDSYTPLGGANNINPMLGILPSNSISTYIGGPPFSAEQFYNPPISNISQLDIYLLDVYGNNLLSPQPCTQFQDPNVVVNTSSYVQTFYFTIRLHYFVKRNNTTQFSVPLFNYAASGTVDSIFQNKRYN
jgi:hypothetical protein